MPLLSTILAIAQANIDRSGQHLMAVFGAEDRPAFVYTVGNARHGLPELLLVGNFDPVIAADILNALGRRMRRAKMPLLGDIDIGGRFPVRVRKASDNANANWTLLAGHYLGQRGYDVLQVLLCDYDGTYPGETGCDPLFDVQLV